MRILAIAISAMLLLLVSPHSRRTAAVAVGIVVPTDIADGTKIHGLANRKFNLVSL